MTDTNEGHSLTRRALNLTALRNSILQAVLLAEQASDCNWTHEPIVAALEARDDMRDAFAAIGIDRETLAKLGDLL